MAPYLLHTLSCKTPGMGEKEMWVYLLTYNLIRLIMLQSALLADVLLSFKHTLHYGSTSPARLRISSSRIAPLLATTHKSSP